MTSALIATMMAVTIMVAFASGARASDLTNTFTGASVREETVYNGGQVVVDFAFTVPAGARGNDTATLQMPTDLRVPAGTSLAVLDADGGQVATATASADGTALVLTFTGYVDTHVGVSGTGFVSTRISHPGANGSAVPLVFTSGSATFTDSIVVNAGNAPRPEWVFVRGWWNDTTDRGVVSPENSMMWQVQTPAGPWTEQTVTFTPDGSVLDCANLTFTQASTAGSSTQHPAASAFTPLADLTGIEVVECAGDHVTVQFELDLDEPHRSPGQREQRGWHDPDAAHLPGQGG